MPRPFPLVFAVAAVALPCASGCAFTQVDVEPPAAQDLNVPSRLGRGRDVIVDIPFDDKRADRGRCGTQKNTYNMETANVVCKIPPAEWVAHALATGLQRAGFHVLVLAGRQPSAPSTVLVHGEVTQFFVEPKVNAFTVAPEADIGVRLVVSSPSGLLAERRFYFKGTDEGLLATEDHFQAAARTATHDAVDSMVGAVVALLDRYPQLGSRP
jgi:hypothetical protein